MNIEVDDASGLDGHAELRSDYILIRRPHFHLHGNALIFMASEHPCRLFSEAEAKLWNLMQQPLSVGEVREACPDCTDALIREFVRSEFCELVEPTFPSERRRVLVIEPHADDAALSIGGVMWLRRRQCAFVVATMASRSNHTLYHGLGRSYFDIEEVTEIRRRESELFARMIGGDHLSMGLTDAALRYRDTAWTLDFFLKHRMSINVGISRIANDQERKLWAEAVLRLLAAVPSAEVWIPLGGPHADHMLTVDACFSAFQSNPSLVAGRVLRIYQDIPYLARFPRYMSDAIENLRRAGVVLERELIPINESYGQKLRLTSVYASQSIRDLRGAIEVGALAYGRAVGYAELLWTMGTLPQNIDPIALRSMAVPERELEDVATAWVSNNRGAEHVRVLLLMPTGRWAADLQLLCSAFPRARFELYVAAAAAAEVFDTLTSRVAVRRVVKGTLAWLFLTLRFAAATKRVPTLFHAGDRRLREARLLSILWLRSDTLVVASMDLLVNALRARREP
jgi:LmbE family N-acetylglucosaminyl deacetylase